MPSAVVMLNVVGAQPGYWILRAFVRVGGKLAHDGNPDNQYCSASLYDLSGNKIRDETSVDSLGSVTWNGTLEGSWSDLFKRGVRVFAYYRRGDLTREVYTDMGLGYQEHDHSDPSYWERWVNLIYKNIDAGIQWYIGVLGEGDYAPYDWWIGQSMEYFIRELENHIELPDEPEWKTKAPDLNIKFTSCPIDGTKLGLTSPGKDVKCPTCGFVSAWSRKPVATTWRFQKLETTR